MSNIPKLSFILILLLSLVNTQEEAKNNTNKITLEENITINIPAKSSTIYDLEQIDLQTAKTWNLFFVAEPIPGSEWEDLDMFISRKSTTGTLTPMIGCQDVGVDSCVIPSKDLRSDDKLSVQFKCMEESTPCKYTFKAYWSENYPISVGRPLRIDFQNQAFAKVFSLDLSNEQFKQVRILLRAETFLVGSSPIKMLANYGKKSPELNSFDISSTHLWDDGQGIFLQKSQMKNMRLTILIEGPAENILRLDTILINQYQNKLSLETPLYDYLDVDSRRSYYINTTQKLIQNDDIMVRVSTFSGRLNVTFYKDSNLKQQILGGQFSHHGELQFRFPRTHLDKQGVKGKLYILVSSPIYASTYVLYQYGRNDTMIKLNNDIQDMAQIYEGEIVNYYVSAFIRSNHTENKQLKFSVHNLIGKVRPYFSVCYEQDIEKCSVSYRAFNISPSSYDQIIPTQVQDTGSSTIYRIQLTQKMFNRSIADGKFKKANVLLLFTSQNGGMKQFTVRYIDERVKILRDGHPIKDRLVMGQKRVYRSVPIQKDVLYVAIHLVQISGITRMIASNKNPLMQEVRITDAIIPVKNQIIYYPQTDAHKRQDPLFITLNAQQNSLYSISLTFFRDSKVSPSPDKTDVFNYITIPENVEQELTIQANTILVVKLQPNSNDYQFVYTSSYPLIFCGRYNSDKIPSDPNCDFNITKSNVKLPNSTNLFIGIKNPNPKIATVRIKYTKTMNSCQTKKLGEVWRHEVPTEEKEACVTYKIPSRKVVEVMVALDKLQTKEGKFSAKINGNTYTFNSFHFIISEQVQQQYCSSLQDCELTLTFSNLSGSHVQAVAQFQNQQLVLLDGLAQDVYSPSSPTIPRYFKFDLVNKHDTTFFLESKKGYYQFYVNVVDAVDISLNWTKLYPKKDMHQFKSEGSRYTIYNQLTISKQNFTNITCTNCVALITVVGSKDQYREQGHFVIQVSQQARNLKEHDPTMGFLTKQSFAFYEYYFPKENGSLIVSLSTQKLKCGTIYISKDVFQKASGNNYIAKSQSGELVIEAEKGKYSITIQASEGDCQYLVSASSSTFKLYQLKPGVHKDLQLPNAWDVAYFYYHHISNSSFKIISVQNYGEVAIFAKQVSQQELQTLQLASASKLDFTWKQSVNALLISTKDKGYKENAYYLIGVESYQPTDTSILLYNGDVDIPLSNSNAITDIVKSGDIMNYKIYAGDSKDLNITLNIYYGEIKVTVLETNQTKTFKSSPSTQSWAMKLDRKETTYKPLKVKIEGVKDSKYLLNLRYNVSSGQTSKMKTGLPSHLFLDNKQTKCLIGEFSDNDPRLVVSVYKAEKQKLKNLKVTSKVNNATILQNSQIVENTMIVSLVNASLNKTISNTIQYCFQSPDGFLSLTIIPTSTITFLPEGTMIPVKTEQNFTLAPNGKIWIEILQCEGTTSLMLSSEFKKIGRSQSQINYWRKYGHNYLIQLEHYGPIYMNVQGKHSLIRWGHYDKDSGVGMGYYALRMSDYTYQMKPDSIIFKIPPVVEVNKSYQYLKSNKNTANFYLMISNSQRQLKKAVQCSQSNNILIESKSFTNLTSNQPFQFIVSVQQINKRFSNDKYLFVGGMLELYVQLSNGVTEAYRYMIESQQIPWTRAYQDLDQDQTDIFDFDNMKKSGSYIWIIFGIILIIILGLLCRFFYKRHQMKKALLANDNTGSLQMRYSEYSVS